MSIKKLLKKLLNVKCIKIISLTFDESIQSLLIHVEPTKGQKHRCPICGKKCSGYDSTTESGRWRHLDFGSCGVYITADVHLIYCPDHGVHTEMVPWAYHHSCFTKEFEQQVSFLALRLNRKEVSRIMRIAWNTYLELKVELNPILRFVLKILEEFFKKLTIENSYSDFAFTSF